jgi:hypothetical protein
VPVVWTRQRRQTSTCTVTENHLSNLIDGVRAREEKRGFVERKELPLPPPSCDETEQGRRRSEHQRRNGAADADAVARSTVAPWLPDSGCVGRGRDAVSARFAGAAAVSLQ